MNHRQLLTILLTATSLTAHAFPGDGEGYGNERRQHIENLRTEFFAEFKAIESMSHLTRIRILHEAEACIQAAANKEQYRACEKHEQASREILQEQVKARHEDLRARAEAVRQRMLSAGH